MALNILNLDPLAKPVKISDSGVFYQPRFSPDGSRIVYIEYKAAQEKTGELYAANPDGTGAKLLDEGVTSFAFGVNNTLLYFQGGYDGSPQPGILPLPHRHGWLRESARHPGGGRFLRSAGSIIAFRPCFLQINKKSCAFQRSFFFKFTLTSISIRRSHWSRPKRSSARLRSAQACWPCSQRRRPCRHNTSGLGHCWCRG